MGIVFINSNWKKICCTFIDILLSAEEQVAARCFFKLFDRPSFGQWLCFYVTFYVWVICSICFFLIRSLWFHYSDLIFSSASVSPYLCYEPAPVNFTFVPSEDDDSSGVTRGGREVTVYTYQARLLGFCCE